MKKLLMMAAMAVGIGTAALAQKSPYTLRYEMKKGDAFYIEQTAEQIISQSFMGTENKQNNDVFSTYDIKVVEPGKLEVTYRRFKNEVKGGGQTMVMDSDGPEDGNPVVTIFKQMVNKPFFVFLSPQGEVTKVEGLTVIINEIIEGLEMEESMKSMLSTQLKGNLSDEAVKSTMQGLFITYPKDAAKLNSTWSESYKTKTMTEMEIKNEHTLVEVKDGKTTIKSVGSNNVVNPDEKVEVMAGVEAKYALKGKTDQTTISDLKSGWPSSIVQNVNLDGVLKLQPGAQIPAEMEVPMSIKSTSKYVISKK